MYNDMSGRIFCGQMGAKRVFQSVRRLTRALLRILTSHAAHALPSVSLLEIYGRVLPDQLTGGIGYIILIASTTPGVSYFGVFVCVLRPTCLRNMLTVLQLAASGVYPIIRTFIFFFISYFRLSKYFSIANTV